MSFFLGDDEADRGPGPDRGAPSVGPGPGAAVAVVDADQAVRSRLAMQLGDFAVPLPSITALADRLTGIPLVAVLGPSCGDEAGPAQGGRGIAGPPQGGAILVAPGLSPVPFRHALE